MNQPAAFTSPLSGLSVLDADQASVGGNEVVTLAQVVPAPCTSPTDLEVPGLASTVAALAGKQPLLSLAASPSGLTNFAVTDGYSTVRRLAVSGADELQLALASNLITISSKL